MSDEVPMKPEGEREHWLARASTLRVLGAVGAVGLVGLVLADLAIEKHGYFALEDSFGFGAWYGFAACVALVFGAKLLGVLLKRPDTTYDE